MLFLNVGQVSNQFVVVSLGRRIEKCTCVMDQWKLCVDGGNILKGF